MLKIDHTSYHLGHKPTCRPCGPAMGNGAKALHRRTLLASVRYIRDGGRIGRSPGCLSGLGWGGRSAAGGQADLPVLIHDPDGGEGNGRHP
jgi:hypothetical protein